VTFKKKTLALLVLALALGACVRRNIPATPAAHAVRKVFYVSAEPFKSINFPSPPIADSMDQKADIAAVLDWQTKRTAADCARASVNADASYDFFWAGKSLFAEPVPAEVKAFFERLASDLKKAADAIKNRYRRPRPYDAYAGVKPCIKKSGSCSYPSGHSLFARVFADVLGDIAPERKDEFIRKADELAEDRVIGGVHYPTDIAAGKLFGDGFHAQLRNNSAYLQDIEKMKTLLIAAKK
jgi:acid phosphatase (class A)